MKRCHWCNEEKALTEFHSNGASGIRAACKSCYNQNRSAQRALDPERHRSRNKEWRANNPEWTREHNRNKSAKRRAAQRDSKTSVAQITALHEINEYLCVYCNTAPAEHIDHVWPLAEGGLHDITNLAPACAPCNLSKGAKLPHVFAAERGIVLPAHYLEGIESERD